MENKVNLFWFRRDLRLEDNIGLHRALQSGNKVVPIFIFDTEIIENLDKKDARISFIYENLESLNKQLNDVGSSLLIKKGNTIDVWEELINDYNIESVFTNKDYEPYAIKRDQIIENLLGSKNINFKTFKDQVIFEENDVLKKDGLPYTVYTPYKNKWLQNFNIKTDLNNLKIDLLSFYKFHSKFPLLIDIGFEKSSVTVKPFNLSYLSDYKNIRDFPAQDKTSYLSPHLRFGSISVRKVVQIALNTDSTFLNELIWREFFMQILFHFPAVVTNNFKRKYDAIAWRNNTDEFDRWCEGNTGYPLVDAGMRQLNATGYMHNRVRMITAGFLCKHLLIDWKWGEAYFAEKLIDYELSANNGNWQWAAGTGCDSAPYFRIFNPEAQLKKFDSKLIYIRTWVTDFDEISYPLPIINHKIARERALMTYKQGLNNFV